MKIPYNKGDAYEEKIYLILKERSLIPKGFKRAGAGIGTDVKFVHMGKIYNLEVKNGTSADYGQSMLRWDGSKWVWSVDCDITRFYTKLGILKLLRKRNMVPIKFNKPNKDITISDRTTDRRVFEKKIKIPTKALIKFYFGKGVFYIQIGKGYGFFHLKKDVAGLGTEAFDGELLLRFRAKTIRSKPPSNYGFYAVLKVHKIKRRSKLNIEPKEKQTFPPITP